MPKVYIPNAGKHDYTEAREFGPLVICTKGTLVRSDTETMFRQISSSLRDSQPDDYIVITSLTTLCSIVCSLFAHKHGRLNLLLFEPPYQDKKAQYLKRTIIFDNGDKDGQREPSSAKAVGPVQKG